jgi:type I restriction enzyme S subunit
MKSDFLPIVDVCKTVVSGGTPLRSHPEYYENGTIPWLKTGDIKKNFVYDVGEYISELGLEKSSAKLIPRNSVLVAMYGDGNTAGSVAVNKIDLATNQACCNLVIDPSKANYLFVYYYLKSSYANLVGLKLGGSQQNLNAKTIKDFPIWVPALKEQNKIAAILSAYDDLIENNKRRIALLEKMAEEIYREWFVRFRFPGYQDAEFEKGIPKGWGLKSFRELVSYYIGGGWGEDVESSTFSKGAFVIRGTDIPPLANGDYSNGVYRFHKPSNFKSRKLQPNDFVFEVSGGSKDQLLGRNLMVTEGLIEIFGGAVICASFCKQIRFNEGLVSPFFMKYFLKLYYECDLVGIYQVQSTGISNYQFESFLNYQTVSVPPVPLLKKFEDMVKPIVRQQETLAREVLNLQVTKNLLLPRLISGKLSVENLNITFPPSMQEVV